jgi:hypothetical protein
MILTVAIDLWFVGFLFALGAFVGMEHQCRNSKYHHAFVSAVGWPIVVLQIAVLGPLFDIYLLDVWRGLKKRLPF